eukprot:CAMPEP_0204422450 /NCGR_PEP_ID=MMETSP0470-20130426/35471_1 /ASSEMBLY_ACC=CAM_ASM_000385 /TAXON_ID=2969 /ORGANISM="Oxyrrhis marina" /LENGTH=56 /DNA_ID=CAMNT_0051419679 /DNA_START=64 /DNA_END=234 /DNA_ORIENTATION=+
MNSLGPLGIGGWFDVLVALRRPRSGAGLYGLANASTLRNAGLSKQEINLGPKNIVQ